MKFTARMLYYYSYRSCCVVNFIASLFQIENSFPIKSCPEKTISVYTMPCRCIAPAAKVLHSHHSERPLLLPTRTPCMQPPQRLPRIPPENDHHYQSKTFVETDPAHLKLSINTTRYSPCRTTFINTNTAAEYAPATGTVPWHYCHDCVQC